MKVALVHYWLVGMRGGEKVLEYLCDLYPDADIFTLFYEPEKISDKIRSHHVFTSHLNNIKIFRKHYTNLFPILPFITEQFDLTKYDLVISSDTLSMKGIITSPDTIHISYCHSPPRYAWDMYFEYLKYSNLKGLKKIVAQYFLYKLRIWDSIAANRVDYFIANSNFVARRIAKTYRRKAFVAHPPIDVDLYELANKLGDYYLSIGQLVPYKRIDLLVDAFNEMPKRRLIIIGVGPQLLKMKKKAKENIEFLGWVDDKNLKGYYKNCKAFLFPGVEDFGITPLEAQACGRPVIAVGKGGVLETVNGIFFDLIDKFDPQQHTGLFFREQNKEQIIKAIETFEEKIEKICIPEVIRKHTKKFKVEIFQENVKNFIETKMKEFETYGPPVSDTINQNFTFVN